MQLKAKALRQLNSCQLQDPALSPTSPCLGRRWQATMMLVMMMTMMLMTMMLMMPSVSDRDRSDASGPVPEVATDLDSGVDVPPDPHARKNVSNESNVSGDDDEGRRAGGLKGSRWRSC